MKVTLFASILVVARLDVCMDVHPGYSSLSLPAVMRKRCLSVFLGKWIPLVLHVTFLSGGIFVCKITKMVFVPVDIQEPNPCASLRKIVC